MMEIEHAQNDIRGRYYEWTVVSADGQRFMRIGTYDARDPREVVNEWLAENPGWYLWYLLEKGLPL